MMERWIKKNAENADEYEQYGETHLIFENNQLDINTLKKWIVIIVNDLDILR